MLRGPVFLQCCSGRIGFILLEVHTCPYFLNCTLPRIFSLTPHRVGNPSRPTREKPTSWVKVVSNVTGREGQRVFEKMSLKDKSVIKCFWLRTVKEWEPLPAYFLSLSFKLEANLHQQNLLLQLHHAVFAHVLESWVGNVMLWLKWQLFSFEEF